ncbi:MAG: F0F1 ATP synthase subunit B [Candidatus Omnitrophota bacterium]
MNINATLLFEVIGFLLLVAVLGKYAYKPLLSFLDERSAEIKKNIEEAEKHRLESEKSYKQAQDDLKEAKKHALFIKEDSQKQADEAREKILREAEERAVSLIEESRKDILSEIEHANAEVKSVIAQSAVAIASKILRKEIKEEEHRALVEEGLKNLSALGKDEK